jgi:hypothetical protein
MTDTKNERTSVTKDEIKIRAAVGGKDYRVTLREHHGYRFMLADRHVMIYTSSSCLGGFSLDRFGGKLCPAGIRKFVTENVRL